MDLEKDMVEIEPSQIKDPDARYLAELDAQVIAKERAEIKNPKYTLGEIAHTHERELSDGRWVAQNCRVVKYRVKNSQGLEVNNKLYVNEVLVPQCLANYLNWMDQESLSNELTLYTNKGRVHDLGEIKNTF